MKKILIVGATSAMARAYARIWADKKAAFFLVARDPVKLQQTADDLLAHGASAVHTAILDVTDIASHKTVVDDCFNKLSAVEVALIAHGTLPDQTACQTSVDTALTEFANNGTSTIALLTELGNRFEQQHFGTIAVITSVAGDRGRPSNYLYGSAKAAVSTFCEGLRARLYKSGVHLVDIRPGFVDTPMTQGLNLPKTLLATPETIATYIDRAISNKKNVIYAPWFWFWILLIIKCLPMFIFKKLNI